MMISQKQPLRAVLRKRCSETMQQINRKTPMPKCDFNKVARHGCSPVNLLHFSEHLFLGTPLDACFWISLQFTMIDSLRLLEKKSFHTKNKIYKKDL